MCLDIDDLPISPIICYFLLYLVSVMEIELNSNNDIESF
jgi:hypothetical protein